MSIEWRSSPSGEKVLHIAGPLDLTKRKDLMAALRNGTHASGPSHIRTDLSGVTLLDTSGLGLLLIIKEHAEKLGRQVILSHCSRPAKSSLSAAGFTRLFKIS